MLVTETEEALEILLNDSEATAVLKGTEEALETLLKGMVEIGVLLTCLEEAWEKLLARDSELTEAVERGRLLAASEEIGRLLTGFEKCDKLADPVEIGKLLPDSVEMDRLLTASVELGKLLTALVEIGKLMSDTEEREMVLANSVDSTGVVVSTGVEDAAETVEETAPEETSSEEIALLLTSSVELAGAVDKGTTLLEGSVERCVLLIDMAEAPEDLVGIDETVAEGPTVD